MHVYQSDLFLFLLASVLCGMLLSGLYDLFRVCRSIFGGNIRGRFSPDSLLGEVGFLSRYNKHRNKHKKREESYAFLIIQFAFDIIYFICVSAAVVLLFYGFNWGRSRLFSFVGLSGGFFLWRIIFGRIIMLFFEYLFYLLGALLYFCFIPLVFLAQKIKKTIYKPFGVVYNKYIEVKNMKKTAKLRQLQLSKQNSMKSVGNNIVVMEKR